MTPEQSKKLWGRSAKGPQHGQWVDQGRGNLVWRKHAKRRAQPEATDKYMTSTIGDLVAELLTQGTARGVVRG